MRKVLLFLGATVVFTAASGVAHADTLKIHTTSNRDGAGGEFKISEYDYALAPIAPVVTAVDGGQFNTFCLEKNEFISISSNPSTGTVYTYTVDAGAINGGVSGGNPDVPSKATALLYYTFWTDQWAVGGLDYDYSDSAGRGSDGMDLQHVIWYLEGEISLSEWNSYKAANSFAADMYNYATSATLDWDDLGQAGWVGTDTGMVRVVNLYDGNGTASQSQLVVVPLPAAALMGFGLLGSMGLVRLLRARRKNDLA